MKRILAAVRFAQFRTDVVRGMLAAACLLTALLAPAVAFAQMAGPQAGEDTPGPGLFHGTQGAPQAAIGPVAAPMFAFPRGAGATGIPAALVANEQTRSLDCMSWAIAYEAGGQPVEGQQAVGQVILNRLRDPHRPKTVCGVVFEGAERSTGCQFTFTCDGSLRRHLSMATMVLARGVAASVLRGEAPDRVGRATHYHADYVNPVWAGTGRRVAKIGAHIFYEMPGHGFAAAEPGTALPTFAIPAGTESALDNGILPRAAGTPAHRTTGRRRSARATPAATMPTPSSSSMFSPWGLPVAASH